MFRVQDYLVLCQTFSYCVFAKKKIPTKNPTASATKMQKWKNISLVISAVMLVSSYFFLIRASHPIQKLTFRFVQECHKDKNSS